MKGVYINNAETIETDKKSDKFSKTMLGTLVTDHKIPKLKNYKHIGL